MIPVEVKVSSKATSDAAKDVDMVDVKHHKNHDVSCSPAPPQIKPPPGFGNDTLANVSTVPIKITRDVDEQAHCSTYSTVRNSNASIEFSLNEIIPPLNQVPIITEAATLFPLPQQQSIVPALDFSHTSLPVPSVNTDMEVLNGNVGDSTFIFGGMETANPFVTTDTSANPLFSNLSTIIDDDSNVNKNNSCYDSNGTDVRNFLNTNLLSSLWMDESKTNNPWAEK